MAPRTRTAIAQGCYLDATGVSVIARIGSGANLLTSKPVRFGLVDADGIPYSKKNNAELIKCYLQLVEDLRVQRAKAGDVAGTLGAAIDAWRQAFPLHVATTGKAITNDTHANDHISLTKHWRTSALAAVLVEDLKRSHVRAQLHAWRDAGGRGSAASTLNHRKRALALVLRWALGADDDEDVTIATDGIERFGEPEPEPRGVPMPILSRILATMSDRGRARKGEARPAYSETKIRMRVIAWTGLAHMSVERLERRKVNFRDSKVFYPPRIKGKNSKKPKVGIWVDGLPEAMEALRDFDRANLWGKPFSRSSMRKGFRRAIAKCRQELVAEAAHTGDDTMVDQFNLAVPPDCTPYDARHSFLTDFYQQSGDHKATKEIGQHASEKTTDRYTKAGVPAAIAAGVEKMRAKWFPNAAKPATVRDFQLVPKS